MISDEELQKLKAALEFRGVKGENGKPIEKYAFMKKKHIKRVEWQRQYTLEDGRNFYVRVFR